MIKNERQYRITNTEAERFRAALAEAPKPAENESRLQRARREALASQLDELDADLLEYKRLRDGGVRTFQASGLEALPRILISARIAQGLTQADLAGRLGLHQQKIQQYEASDYLSASFSRLLEIADRLNVVVSNEAALADDLTGAAFLHKLTSIGFDRAFIEKRLVPLSLRGQLEDSPPKADLVRAASFASKALDVKLSAFLSHEVPRPNLGPLQTVRHKLAKGANRTKVGLYTIYAHYLALLALEATRHIAQRPTPEDTDDLHDGIREAYGALDLKSALAYVWDHLGIPVLPLRLHGGFHGATWRVRGANAVVLNPSQSFPAFWLNDLFHEVGHTTQDPEDEERAIVEVEPTWESLDDSEDERDARRFAVDTVFRSRGDELAAKCEKIAGSVEGLKRSVSRVALEEAVPEDSLALFMASRLKSVSWWGPAMNLQDKSTDSFEMCRSLFLERADLSRLSPDDREMLLLGLQGDEA